MTHDDSVLLAQTNALKSADAGAVFAELTRAGLQALIEAEATDKIGAGRYQRSENRGTLRDGHRSKTVSTTSGDIEVEMTCSRFPGYRVVNRSEAHRSKNSSFVTSSASLLPKA